MSNRKSIHVESFSHVNPIPAGCRIGDLFMSGGLHGMDPVTKAIPPTLEEQCANMFVQVRNVVEAAGGSIDDIIKMTVWLTDPSKREALNAEWLKMFPDEQRRPARHTMKNTLDAFLIQCDVTALIGQGKAAG